MQVIYLIIISTLIVSLISFIGIFTLALKKIHLNKILLILVALSAGALMGGAFLHLIPESIENSKNPFIIILIGFITFFFIEKILYWRHCHNGICKVHTFAYMNLIGDSVHNFIDGLIIAASFLTNVQLGIVTTIAVALHEIPQEIGDYGVLVYGGFKKYKALLLNFLTALFALLGGIIGFFISSSTQQFVTILLPFAAGGFIYIGASDLIPELKKEIKFKKSLISFIFFIIGILIVYSIKFII